MRASIFSLILLHGMACQALAWGDLGHRAIAEAVQANLTPAADKAVAQIAGDGEALQPGTLARMSLWPDQIRPLNKNPGAFLSGFTRDEFLEAQAFVRAHPDNSEWHFVDLPPGASHYPDTRHTDPTDPVLPFTSLHDIVHMIVRCIEILEADGAPAGFSKLQALRWLLHLVEDLHQPLHVASGYYSTASRSLEHPQRINDPAAVTEQQAKNDRGGNVLLFSKHPQCPTKPTRENLHSAWDDCLVDMVNGKSGCVSPTTDEDVAHLTEILKAKMAEPSTDSFKNRGDYHDWPAQWATDSLVVARTALNVELAEACLVVSEKPPHDPIYVQSRIVKPESKKQYLREHKADAEMQVTKAAVRLTDLLNHLAWK